MALYSPDDVYLVSRSKRDDGGVIDEIYNDMGKILGADRVAEIRRSANVSYDRQFGSLDKAWLDVWEQGFFTHHPRTDDFFIHDITVLGGPILRLLPVYTPQVAAEKYNMTFQGDVISYDQWNLPTHVLGEQSNRTPVAMNTDSREAHTRSIRSYSNGFEIALNFAMDQKGRDLFFNKLEQMATNFHISMIFHILETIVQEGLIYHYQRIPIPMTPTELEQYQSLMYNRRMALTRAVGNMDMLEVYMNGEGTKRGVKFDTILVSPGTVMRNAVGGGDKNQSTDSEGTARSARYGYRIIESREFTLPDNTVQDPTQFICRTSEWFAMQWESIVVGQDVPNATRAISINDGANIKMYTVKISEAFDNSGIYDAHGTLTPNGQDLLRAIIAQGYNDRRDSLLAGQIHEQQHLSAYTLINSCPHEFQRHFYRRMAALTPADLATLVAAGRDRGVRGAVFEDAPVGYRGGGGPPPGPPAPPADRKRRVDHDDEEEELDYKHGVQMPVQAGFKWRVGALAANNNPFAHIFPVTLDGMPNVEFVDDAGKPASPVSVVRQKQLQDDLVSELQVMIEGARRLTEHRLAAVDQKDPGFNDQYLATFRQKFDQDLNRLTNEPDVHTVFTMAKTSKLLYTVWMLLLVAKMIVTSRRQTLNTLRPLWAAYCTIMNSVGYLCANVTNLINEPTLQTKAALFAALGDVSKVVDSKVGPVNAAIAHFIENGAHEIAAFSSVLSKPTELACDEALHTATNVLLNAIFPFNLAVFLHNRVNVLDDAQKTTEVGLREQKDVIDGFADRCRWNLSPKTAFTTAMVLALYRNTNRGAGVVISGAASGLIKAMQERTVPDFYLEPSPSEFADHCAFDLNFVSSTYGLRAAVEDDLPDETKPKWQWIHNALLAFLFSAYDIGNVANPLGVSKERASQLINKLVFVFMSEHAKQRNSIGESIFKETAHLGLSKEQLSEWIGNRILNDSLKKLVSARARTDGKARFGIDAGDPNDAPVITSVSSVDILGYLITPLSPTGMLFWAERPYESFHTKPCVRLLLNRIASFEPFAETRRVSAPAPAPAPVPSPASSFSNGDRADFDAILRNIDLGEDHFFRLCIELDLPFPLSFILFRPLTETRTGSMIMMRSGEETGCVVIKEGSLFFTRIDNTYSARVSGRFARRAIIRKKENIEILVNVRATAFLYGGGVSFWNASEENDITTYRDNPRAKDIFSCAVHIGWTDRSRATIDMTGRIHHALINQTNQTEYQYPTAPIYSAIWGWVHHPLIHILSIEALRVRDDPVGLRAFTHCRAGCYYTWNQAKGDMIKLHRGRSELGLEVRPELYEKLRGSIDHGNFVTGRSLAQEHTL